MRLVAIFMNADKTVGAKLWDNGILDVMQRENSGQMWSPATALTAEDFVVKGDDRLNLVGVTWTRAQR